jgi:hypothetical protein
MILMPTQNLGRFEHRICIAATFEGVPATLRERRNCLRSAAPRLFLQANEGCVEDDRMPLTWRRTPVARQLTARWDPSSGLLHTRYWFAAFDVWLFLLCTFGNSAVVRMTTPTPITVTCYSNNIIMIESVHARI